MCWYMLKRKLQLGMPSQVLIPSLPESIMEICSIVLTFESVNEILWCNHSNETLLVVLLHGVICFFSTLQNKNLDFFWLSWESKG